MGVLASCAMTILGAAALMALAPATAWGRAQPEHEPGAHSAVRGANGTDANFGTDIVFDDSRRPRYALAGSYRNGLQIVDITRPDRATIAAVYDCGVTQGDVQVFRQKSKPGRIFAGYTSDTFGDGTSTCYREAEALGFSVKKPNGSGKNGTFIVELTNPLAPKTVSFVEVEQGSHNHTIHPSGNYLYNSNSDLITSFQPAIEIFDISNSAPSRTTSASRTTASAPTRPRCRREW